MNENVGRGGGFKVQVKGERGGRELRGGKDNVQKFCFVGEGGWEKIKIEGGVDIMEACEGVSWVVGVEEEVINVAGDMVGKSGG